MRKVQCYAEIKQTQSKRDGREGREALQVEASYPMDSIDHQALQVQLAAAIRRRVFLKSGRPFSPGMPTVVTASFNSSSWSSSLVL